MIKNVLVDVGGVLIDLHRSVAVDRLRELGVTDADEMLDAYVTDIQGTPADPNAYHMQWDGSSGDLTLSQSQDGAYNVVFTIEGTVKDNLTSELGTQEIRVGKTHIVKTTTFELEGGCIISCERLADEGAEG